MPSGIVINGVEDTVAVTLEILESAKQEIEFLVSPSLLSIMGTYGTMQSAKRFIQNGGALRGITTISLANVEEARVRLDVGENLRHSDQPHEIFMFVGDKQYSISSINVGIDAYTRATPLVAFWSESSSYAEYLLASFEYVWSQSMPAEERIQELLTKRPPQDER